MSRIQTLFGLLLLLLGLPACDASSSQAMTSPAYPASTTTRSVAATATAMPDEPTPAPRVAAVQPAARTATTAQSPSSAADAGGHRYFLLGGRGPSWMLDAAGIQRDFPTVDDAPGHAVFSPDGRRIAYGSNADDWRSRLVIANVDGSEAVALQFVPDQLVLMPARSPDGRRIAFSADFRAMGQNPDLYVVDVAAAMADVAAGETPVATPLVEAPGFDLAPAWSPDGRDIAFSSTGATGNAYDIYLISAEGGEPRRATTLDGDEGEPAWSPDGDQIAFVTYTAEDRGRLAVLPLAQLGAPEQMPRYVDHPGPAHSPVWTTDGDLLFLADGQLIASDSAGALTQLAADVGSATHVHWQQVPDGALPALSETGTFQLQPPYLIATTLDGAFALNADGSGMIRILPRTFAPTASALSPDGAQVAVAGCCLVDTGAPLLLLVESATLDWRVATPLSGDPACVPNGADSRCGSSAAINRIIWSPDGSYLALSGLADAEDPASAAIWLFETGDSSVEMIFAGRGEDVTFSADSARLYFLGYRNGESGLFVAAAPGYEPLRVTGDAFAIANPGETDLHVVPARP